MPNMEQTHRYKVMKTIFMVLGPATMGLYLEIAGPALPDLKNKLSATYEEIARVLVARSVGYFVSALLGGTLADFYPYHIEVILSVAYLVSSVGTAIIPWSGALWVMAIMFHLQGLGEGIIDTCNNSLCARIWGDKAAAPLHALHFGFGIGALMAPILAGPFISDVSPLVGNATDATDSSHTTISYVIRPADNGSVTQYHNGIEEGDQGYSENIYIPYTISSILTFFTAISFLGLYIYEKYMDSKQRISDLKRYTGDLKIFNQELKKLKEDASEYNTVPNEPDSSHEEEALKNDCAKALQIIHPGSCTDGDTIFGIKIFILIFLFYLNIVGGERAYGKYIYTYAIESKSRFTREQATLLNSLFWLCFTAGRGVAIILSRIFKPTLLLSIELFTNITSGVILCIYGYEVKIVLFVCTVLLGFTLSPIFPGGLAWANLYVKLTGMAMAIVFTGGACGGMIYQWITGWLFDIYGSESLSFVMVGYATALSCIFLLMLLFARKRTITLS